MKTLIITEKPDVARRIASAIGSPKRHGKAGVYYYEVNGVFIAPVVGHVYSLDEKTPGRWTYPVFDIEWKPSYKLSKGAKFTKKYLDNIERLSKKCDSFINSCDYDIEGEVIGYNVIKYACDTNPLSDQIRRMKYSTLTKESILSAYENLKQPDRGMADSGLARHMLDWYWGINLSRALSLSMRSVNRYATLSIGRVQGPTLNFLSMREREILSFKPQFYWQLEMICLKDDEKFSAFHIEDKFWEKEKAIHIKEKCRDTAVVSSVKSEQFRQKPPTPFDLTTLQTEAYKCLRIDPKRTLQIAQDLYTSAYISYPRTASEQLPPDINYRGIMTKLRNIEEYAQLVDIFQKKELKPNNGKKKDPAHPAIYPTGEIPTALDPQHRKIYDLIVHRFFATFGDDAIRESVVVELDNNGEIFVVKGISTIEKGWHNLYQKYLKLDEIELPKVTQGEMIVVDKIELLEKETKPSKRYTPASIIRKMERENIGTKATRAGIVDILFKRGYLTGKTIKVTKLGLSVVDTLSKYCPEVLSIELTKNFEEEMEKIQEGTFTAEQMIEEGKMTLTRITKELKDNERNIGRELSGSILAAQKAKDSLGGCIKCDGSMVMRKSKRGDYFIGCDNYPKCTFTMSLPKGKLKKVSECGKCGYAILQVSGKKPWRFCVNPECPTKKNSF